MRLIAISRVKNERDIIEPFVRHHCAIFDRLIVLDDGSSDGTYQVLQALRAEGLPLVLIHDPAVGYEQGRYMTRLLRMAVRQYGADWVMPLDADEFVETEPGQTLAQILSGQAPQVLKLAWHGFAWRPEHDESAEPNPIVRMRDRMPPSPDALRKVLIPASVVADDVHLGQGNHELFRVDDALPAGRFDSVRLCHFPIRSVAQYAGKIAVGYLQYAATPGWNRRAGFHYYAPYRALTEGLDQFVALMSADSRRYSFEPGWPDPGAPAEAPFDYRGGPLLHLAATASPLGSVLNWAETVAGKLVEISGQVEAAQYALLAANGVAPGEAASIVAQEADARMAVRATPRASTAQHTFQSFWGGGPLSPYEALCLKSFIDCGHAFDLYTFEMDLKAPAGVCVRDAREFFSPDEFFVYAEGFGKGSPAAFANLFRCKLMAERGGWWVDTDVVCVARDIPAFTEFYAWEDARLINNAVLYLEAGHPVAVACLAEAQQRGRGVRWGEIGPNLTTRVVRDLGYTHRAYPSSLCYPVHYSEAIEILRPSKTQALRQRTANSLFVHLWNAMFAHRGVDKTMLPPNGSILREWIGLHPVDGWAGEYSAESLERALRPDTEPRMRLSAELASGLEDIAGENARLKKQSEALRSHNTALEEELEAAARREKGLRAERDIYVAIGENRRVEAEMMRNSTSWKLTDPLRRGIGWWRTGRRQ